jgi:uncharacterized phage protein (TIGR01671 family)
MYFQLSESPCFGLFEGDKAVSIEDVFFYEKQDFEVMQYTGLKDKNGKEIYEGDIVEAHTFDENIDKKQVGRVAYHNGRLGFVFIPKELEKKNLYYPLFSIVTCELIGNINENPELLMS